MLKTLANAVLFQCGWFACVLGGDSVWLLVGLAALAIHLLWISSWAEDGRLILSVTVLGTLLDTALRTVGEPVRLGTAVGCALCTACSRRDKILKPVGFFLQLAAQSLKLPP